MTELNDNSSSNQPEIMKTLGKRTNHHIMMGRNSIPEIKKSHYYENENIRMS